MIILGLDPRVEERAAAIRAGWSDHDYEVRGRLYTNFNRQAKVPVPLPDMTVYRCRQSLEFGTHCYRGLDGPVRRRAYRERP